MKIRPVLAEKPLQRFGLGDSARVSVEHHAVLPHDVMVKHIVKNLGHKPVGYELPLRYVLVGSLAEFRPAGYVVAQQLSGGDVMKSVLCDQFLALGPLPLPGAPNITRLNIIVL